MTISPIYGRRKTSNNILTKRLKRRRAKKRSLPKRLFHLKGFERYSEKSHTIKYVTIPSMKTDTAAHGLEIIRGTIYPGTTSPDKTQPRRRLKNVETTTPTKTVVVTELAKLP